MGWFVAKVRAKSLTLLRAPCAVRSGSVHSTCTAIEATVWLLQLRPATGGCERFPVALLLPPGHSPLEPTGAAGLGQRSVSALRLEPGAWR